MHLVALNHNLYQLGQLLSHRNIWEFIYVNSRELAIRQPTDLVYGIPRGIFINIQWLHSRPVEIRMRELKPAFKPNNAESKFVSDAIGTNHSSEVTKTTITEQNSNVYRSRICLES